MSNLSKSSPLAERPSSECPPSPDSAVENLKELEIIDIDEDGDLVIYTPAPDRWAFRVNSFAIKSSSPKWKAALGQSSVSRARTLEIFLNFAKGYRQDLPATVSDSQYRAVRQVLEFLHNSGDSLPSTLEDLFFVCFCVHQQQVNTRGLQDTLQRRFSDIVGNEPIDPDRLPQSPPSKTLQLLFLTYFLGHTDSCKKLLHHFLHYNVVYLPDGGLRSVPEQPTEKPTANDPLEEPPADPSEEPPADPSEEPPAEPSEKPIADPSEKLPTIDPLMIKCILEAIDADLPRKITCFRYSNLSRD
jgi:hypothetical protein